MSWHVLNEASEVALARFPENAFDAVVCDPPAWIDFMGKSWDSTAGYRSFVLVMAQCFRVLKPGGYALVWGIPRTSFFTALGLYDAGFEVRDRIHHVFGSGMPHARDASKALDAKLLGEGWEAQRPVIGEYRAGGNAGMSTEEKGGTYAVGVGSAPAVTLKRTIGATPAARERDDWHTNLKPGCEDWYMARKPLAGTLADTLIAHGVGALNIGATRVPRDWDERGEAWKGSGVSAKPEAEKIAAPPGQGMILHPGGGWPANFVMSHSDACSTPVCSVCFSPQFDTSSGTTCANGHGGAEGIEPAGCAPDCPVAAMDAQAGPLASSGGARVYGSNLHGPRWSDGGGASRYFNVFYSPKASAREREAGCDALPAKTGGEATGRKDGSAGVNRPQAGAGRGGGRRNDHPTVKGLELMRYLVRLVTPPGGIIVDPYLGSGSTGCAAVVEGFNFLGIDGEAHYCDISRARITHWEGKR